MDREKNIVVKRNNYLEQKLDLKNKKVVVTGGSLGIGKVVSIELARLGCHVAIFDILEKEGEETTKQIFKNDGVAYFYKCDVTKQDDVKECFSSFFAKVGRIDILINNVGTTMPKKIEETSLTLWNKLLKINLTSSFICSKESLKYFKLNKKGTIVFISSGSAITGSGGSIAYTAAKGGVNSLVRGLAREFADFNIRVNGVAPRSISSPILDSLYKNDSLDDLRRKIPLKRLGLFEDVANAVIFLASELSSFIDGETLLIDGGRTYLHK